MLKSRLMERLTRDGDRAALCLFPSALGQNSGRLLCWEAGLLFICSLFLKNEIETDCVTLAGLRHTT